LATQVRFGAKHFWPGTRLAYVANRVTGATSKAFFLSPPLGIGSKEHLLVLECVRIEIPPELDKPTMVLLGGYDVHETEPGIMVPTGFLAAMYPAASHDNVRRRIGSIDILPTGDTVV
jgi:hypothetical protein